MSPLVSDNYEQNRAKPSPMRRAVMLGSMAALAYILGVRIAGGIGDILNALDYPE